MRKRLLRSITMILSLWIFLGGSIGQVYAQDEFNPTPPPEPGKLTLLLSADPHGSPRIRLFGANESVRYL
ncbi:hypothetical protein [Parabacteroides distasonis]|uniref:hypothetical protein n=1 Tax=Parabacteroides distasonis TaxID=823 RepID=UPI001F45D5DA|nr:hypothetical protein [Parabacteroides distasonis]